MRTVKIAYTSPQRRSLREKLRYKLAVRRKGGPVWARIGTPGKWSAAIPGTTAVGLLCRQCWPTAAPLIWRNDC